MSLYLKLKNLMLISALALLLVSCGGGSNSTTTSSPTTKINGVAQKGPFSVGSKVIIHEINSSGMQISEPVESKVSGMNGKFSFEKNPTISDIHYRIKVTGTFFSESTGSDSENSIALTAITNDQRNSSINILTQWQSQRTDTLLANGKSLKISLEQSQKELIKLFGINNSNSLDISASSTSMDENNAMLLLFSGVLMNASSKYKISSQTIIDEIGNDFADDGKLNEKGDEWFIRLQSLIKDNPKKHTKSYASVISDMLGYKITSEKYLPDLIPLASRPSAIVPPVYLVAPSETLTLDGSESHDSGNIINYTWFRVDQQTQYNIQVSERFSASPTITVPNEAAVLAAPNQEIILLYALVVTDADKLTHTATVKVIIRVPLPENNPPIAIAQIDDQAVVTNEDTPVDITLEGSDPDGDEINFVITTPLMLPNGLLEGIPPNLKFTPTPNFNGTDHFNFQVDDDSLTSASARVDIIVLPVNDPPVADDKTVVTDEDTPVTINFTGSDIEDDPLVFRIGPQTPSNGNLSGAAPSVVYTPESNFFGNDSFNYIAFDGNEDSRPATVNIIVNPVNDPPIANPQNVITNEDTPINITLTGSDVEGDPLLFNLGGITLQNGSFNGTTPPNLTYTPVADFIGSDSFNFTVTDGSDTSIAALVNIQVLPVNDNLPPVADAGDDIPISFSGDPLQLNGSGNDPEDGTNVTYEWSAPLGIELSSTSVPDPTFFAPSVTTQETFTISLIVRDSESLASDPSTMQVTVNPASMDPIADAGPDDSLGYNGESLNIYLDGSASSDPNSSVLTYSWERVLSTATIYEDDNFDPDDINTPQAMSTLSGNPPDTVTFRLTVTNTDGLMDTNEVTYTIQDIPRANYITACIVDYFPLIPLSINLGGVDPDGGVDPVFTYKIVDPPSSGTLNVMTDVEFTDNTVLYTPFDEESPTLDSFTYTVKDVQGWESLPETVSIEPSSTCP